MLKTWSFWKTFLTLYLTLVAGIWGFGEAYTYFKDDSLKQILGSTWWIIYYLLPLIGAVLIALSKKCKRGAQRKSHWKSILPVAIKFFFHEETAHFVKKLGRYSDQLKFSIKNSTAETIESLKVDFIFPKLETLVVKKQFPEFRLVTNNSDFHIQEYDSAYKIVSETYKNLLPGDTINIPRACIIYVMNLPDKDKWIEAVKKSRLRLSWTLFSNQSKPQKGFVRLKELYIGISSTVEQRTVDPV